MNECLPSLGIPHEVLLSQIMMNVHISPNTGMMRVVA